MSAGFAHGIASTNQRSCGCNHVQTYGRIPSTARRRVGHVTSTRLCDARRIEVSAAPERWPSIDSWPHASAAAIQRPFSETFGWAHRVHAAVEPMQPAGAEHPLISPCEKPSDTSSCHDTTP
jgi:hypothetical protein